MMPALMKRRSSGTSQSKTQVHSWVAASGRAISNLYTIVQSESNWLEAVIYSCHCEKLVLDGLHNTCTGDTLLDEHANNDTSGNDSLCIADASQMALFQYQLILCCLLWVNRKKHGKRAHNTLGLMQWLRQNLLCVIAPEQRHIEAHPLLTALQQDIAQFLS